MCIERGAADLDKLGYGRLNKKNAQVFLPAAGNEPLIDFVIFDEENTSYPFSVKKISKTTNVVKPQDIISLINKKQIDGNKDDWVEKYKKTVEFKILEVLAENKVRDGSFLALELIAKDLKLKTKLPT